MSWDVCKGFWYLASFGDFLPTKIKSGKHKRFTAIKFWPSKNHTLQAMLRSFGWSASYSDHPRTALRKARWHQRQLESAHRWAPCELHTRSGGRTGNGPWIEGWSETFPSPHTSIARKSQSSTETNGIPLKPPALSAILAEHGWPPSNSHSPKQRSKTWPNETDRSPSSIINSALFQFDTMKLGDLMNQGTRMNAFFPSSDPKDSHSHRPMLILELIWDRVGGNLSWMTKKKRNVKEP